MICAANLIIAYHRNISFGYENSIFRTLTFRSAISRQLKLFRCWIFKVNNSNLPTKIIQNGFSNRLKISLCQKCFFAYRKNGAQLKYMLLIIRLDSVSFRRHLENNLSKTYYTFVLIIFTFFAMRKWIAALYDHISINGYKNCFNGNISFHLFILWEKFS